ncbi:hypothetical protein TBK1r_02650 [Stieleria magnilauensis]|uniref:ASCH domain protein n=2 Tax=Stieleria magnilauensis TaxID=2527963 RepID=A0ABX5XJ03_9BACT|nr:hypothetical protein TBK1r_02650 [Planctomycetes bacterium TBK1r]
MARAARAFQENQGTTVIRSIDGGLPNTDRGQLPWQSIHEGQMPPMMLQVRLRDGVIESFPYGDLRRIRCRDAGSIHIETFSSPRTIIRIEGRHLRELAALLGNAMIQWIEEFDTRNLDRPEHLPTITRIFIELLPNA